jgi:hypothetical protein
LQHGLDLQPDVLFFATDADDLTVEQIDKMTRYNVRHCAIHVIEFSEGPEGAASPLRLLAAQNGGTYRRVVVKEL